MSDDIDVRAVERQIQREHHQLHVHITDGQLVISLGIATLAIASRWHPSGPVTVTDQVGFAHDVMAALTEEDEAGFSAITRMIDKAISAAVEAGSVHVNEEEKR